MKSFIVLALFVAAAAAAPAPAGPEADAVVVKQSLDNIGVGDFQSEVETSNGIKEVRYGRLENPNTDDAALVIEGSYEYVGPDGVLYRITYIADREGFRASGAHIPTAR